MSKVHLLEATLPILLALKHALDKIQSPLSRDLLACLRDVLKTHGSDVDAVLATDPHLARELKYDLKRADDAKRASLPCASQAY